MPPESPMTTFSKPFLRYVVAQRKHECLVDLSSIWKHFGDPRRRGAPVVAGSSIWMRRTFGGRSRAAAPRGERRRRRSAPRTGGSAR